MGGGLLRRRCLGRIGAGVLAAGPVLQACARQPGGASHAAPAPAQGEIVLRLAPNWQGSSWNTTAQQLNQTFFDQNFTPAHPGLRVLVVPPVQGAANAQIAASLSGGDFADVFQDCCRDLPVWEQAGLLAPLDDYLHRDNVPTSLWSQSHLAVLTSGGRLLALPAYDGPCVIFYRQDLLDALGLGYPDPGWTVEEATQLWTQCTGSTAGGSQQPGGLRAGMSIFNTPYDLQIHWWLRGWGAQQMNQDGTVCLMDSPQAVAMAAYMQHGAQSKVLTDRAGVDALLAGRVVFKMAGGWELLPAATQLGTKVKWDILPVPKWPAGRSTFNNIDFYALNAASRHPDAAWELLRYVCAEPDYQRFQMRTTLVQPCLLSLWEEWETAVVAVAPPLHGKAISWFRDAATGGYAWPTIFFKYNPVQAGNVISNWMAQIWAGQVSPQIGLQQLTQQINALEQAGAVAAPARQQAEQRFPTQGPAMAAVPTGI